MAAFLRRLIDKLLLNSDAKNHEMILTNEIFQEHFKIIEQIYI